MYDLFALKTEMVVLYHQATPPPSPMLRMKWCNGRGSSVMCHERWPISISESVIGLFSL